MPRNQILGLFVAVILISSSLGLSNFISAYADSGPAGTTVATGQQHPEPLHNVRFSNPGAQTQYFPNPTGSVKSIFSTVTTYVHDAVLYYDINGITYSVGIGPNSNTLITFPSAVTVSNVYITIRDRGYSDDQGNVAYVYGSANSLPPGTTISTGQQHQNNLNNVVFSNPGAQTQYFPTPSGPVTGIFSTVTTYVQNAMLHFDSGGTTYSVGIGPNSNTLISFGSPLTISNVRISIQDRGYSNDQANVEYRLQQPADPDSDGDGIKDSADQCDYESETINGYQDSDGCPDNIPPPTGGSDLVIEQVYLQNSAIQPNSKTKIAAKASNIGSTKSAQTNIAFYVDDSYFFEVSIGDWHPGGGTIETSKFWTYDGKPHTIKACIDARNSVSESNEGNNCQSISISQNTSSQFDFSINLSKPSLNMREFETAEMKINSFTKNGANEIISLSCISPQSISCISNPTNIRSGNTANLRITSSEVGEFQITVIGTHYSSDGIKIERQITLPIKTTRIISDPHSPDVSVPDSVFAKHRRFMPPITIKEGTFTDRQFQGVGTLEKQPIFPGGFEIVIDSGRYTVKTNEKHSVWIDIKGSYDKDQGYMKNLSGDVYLIFNTDAVDIQSSEIKAQINGGEPIVVRAIKIVTGLNPGTSLFQSLVEKIGYDVIYEKIKEQFVFDVPASITETSSVTIIKLEPQNVADYESLKIQFYVTFKKQGTHHLLIIPDLLGKYQKLQLPNLITIPEFNFTPAFYLREIIVEKSVSSDKSITDKVTNSNSKTTSKTTKSDIKDKTPSTLNTKNKEIENAEKAVKTAEGAVKAAEKFGSTKLKEKAKNDLLKAKQNLQKIKQKK